MTVALLFPGQGSQSKGMGGDLFGRFPEMERTADEILGYSIRDLCLNDPHGRLGQTQYTQPAIYTVNALSYRRFQEERGVEASYAAGHSLGEYNALFASGVFDFGTGLQLVQRRGALMAQATGGAMAAVIGLTLDQIRDVILLFGSTDVSIANLNSPTQTVLSGTSEAITEIESAFKEAGARMFLPLPVSGAFHSKFMEPARREFETFLQSFHFADPQIPVISNVGGTPYPAGRATQLLGQQITSPVRWVDSMKYLLAQPEISFEEVGPGNTLQGLLRQIRASMQNAP